MNVWNDGLHMIHFTSSRYQERGKSIIWCILPDRISEMYLVDYFRCILCVFIYSHNILLHVSFIQMPSPFEPYSLGVSYHS